MNDVVGEILSNPIVHTIGAAILLAAVALWLAAAWWAFLDARRRSESSLAGYAAAGWVILSSPLLLPLSLAVYAVARPQVTASDSRTQLLMGQLTEIAADRPTCPGCESAIDADWLRCPWCATWFAVECDACGEWSAAGLEVCPFCGTERDIVPAGWVPADLAAAAAATVPAGHAAAAAGEPAAAAGMTPSSRLRGAQRGRMASSWRPSRYASSRASSSVSS